MQDSGIDQSAVADATANRESRRNPDKEDKEQAAAAPPKESTGKRQQFDIAVPAEKQKSGAIT